MSITLVTGPMFSGKTSYLMKKIAEKGTRSFCVIKHSLDVRYTTGKELVNHDMDTLDDCEVFYCNDETLKETLDIAVKGFANVAFDEGHFFLNIAEMAQDLASVGIHVYIAALNSTFQQLPFPAVTKLLPLVTDVVFLKGKCSLCSAHASSAYTMRKSSSKDLFLVGSSNIYYSVCPKCLFEEKNVMLEENK